MAKVLATYDFDLHVCKRGKKAEPTRFKMVFRILNSWGGKVVEQFDYKDKAKAEQKLSDYHSQGKATYYLQMVKVPM